MDTQTKTEATQAADAALVAMAKAGDELAVTRLVAKYWPEAYRVALRILRSHEDAEEVAQDALWAATTHLSEFREDASFRTWLHRITVNHSLMAMRRRRSRAPGSLCPLSDNASASCMDGPRTPEELLLETECRTVVEEGLSRVPALYSVALHLATREGRSGSEIAECMGISETAVKTRLHRGRAYLRREILPRLCVKSTRTSQVIPGAVAYGRKGESAVAA